jgi:hypothetical protein
MILVPLSEDVECAIPYRYPPVNPILPQRQAVHATGGSVLLLPSRHLYLDRLKQPQPGHMDGQLPLGPPMLESVAGT